MRRVAIISLLSNLSLFATENLPIEESIPWLREWLILALLTIGLMFWSIFKLMKTKNLKYVWGMILSLVLLIVLLFL